MVLKDCNRRNTDSHLVGYNLLVCKMCKNEELSYVFFNGVQQIRIVTEVRLDHGI